MPGWTSIMHTHWSLVFVDELWCSVGSQKMYVTQQEEEYNRGRGTPNMQQQVELV